MTTHPAGGPVPPDAVEALIEEAVEAIVRTPEPAACLALVDDLEQRGALWLGMLHLLGPVSGRALFGLDEENAARRLAALADTPDRVTGLTYRLWLAFRTTGAAAAREVWEAADPGLRRAAAVQQLVGHCHTIGGEGGRLSARQTARLLRATATTTW